MAVEYLASNEFPGNGVKTDFDISFAGVRPDDTSGTTPYLNATDVKVQEVIPATQDSPEQVIDRTGSLIDANTFRVSGAPVVTGHIVRIYRATETDYNLVDYSNLQTVKEGDLDLANRQLLFVVQESHDLAVRADQSAQDGNAIAYNALTVAQDAQDKAEDAQSNVTIAINVANSALGVANSAVGIANNAVTEANEASADAAAAAAKADDAKDASDAVVGTANAAVATANAAAATANTALTTANGIDGKAQNALDQSAAASAQAASADANATTALNTANAIDGKAQSALDASAAATTTANAANATANGVDAKAQSALDASAANTAAISTLNGQAVKTFKGRAPVAGNINPLAGDYDISMITNSGDASRLDTGIIPQGRVVGSYPVYALGWQTARTLTVRDPTNSGSNGGNPTLGTVSIQGTGDMVLNLKTPSFGATGYIVPSGYANNWSNISGSEMFITRVNNVVYINGQVRKTSANVITIGETMFVLPVGYRPARQQAVVGHQFQDTPGGWAVAAITIDSDGTVKYVTRMAGTGAAPTGGTITVGINVSYVANDN